MDLNTSVDIMVRTHMAAITQGYRATAIEQISGPGIGKSDSKRVYAARMAKLVGEPVGYVRFLLATVSSVDMKGFMMPVKAPNSRTLDTIFSTPPWFPTEVTVEVFLPDGSAVDEGQWKGDVPSIGILDLDEFGQADDEVKKPAGDLLLNGNVGSSRLPRNWRVVAASNRMSDRSGVARNLMFLVNRRAEHRIDASCPVWLTWANAQPEATRPHYLTISFAQKNPDIVFRDSVPDGTDPFCTPRTLCLMDRDLRALRSPEDIARNRLPLDAAAREHAAGLIGQGAAGQFFSHLKYADELPDMADIERDPSKAKVPANRDAQMVCGYMLAHHVEDKNALNVMRYIERLNVEMQILSVRAITAQAETAPERTAAIVNTTAFSSWLAKHKDLLVASRA